ncbi:hypothetical protein [Pseudanabaena galeata]
MTLALMVYSLGQRQLRLALEKANATLPDQKGKPIALLYVGYFSAFSLFIWSGLTILSIRLSLQTDKI